MLLIGRGPSGQDISLELAASGAKEVVVAVLDYDPNQILPKHDQRIIKPAIDHITDSGNVVFEDGSLILAPDEIIYCTGYLYAGRDLLPDELLFPMVAIHAQTGELGTETIEGLRDVADNDLAVAPLYKHVFAIEDPTVGFIALATGSLPFLCSEIQARWAARVFASVSPLPSRHEMYSELFELVKKLDGKFKNLHKTEQRQCFMYVHCMRYARLVARGHSQLAPPSTTAKLLRLPTVRWTRASTKCTRTLASCGPLTRTTIARRSIDATPIAASGYAV